MSRRPIPDADLHPVQLELRRRTRAALEAGDTLGAIAERARLSLSAVNTCFSGTHATSGATVEVCSRAAEALGARLALVPALATVPAEEAPSADE